MDENEILRRAVRIRNDREREELAKRIQMKRMALMALCLVPLTFFFVFGNDIFSFASGLSIEGLRLSGLAAPMAAISIAALMYALIWENATWLVPSLLGILFAYAIN